MHTKSLLAALATLALAAPLVGLLSAAAPTPGPPRLDLPIACRPGKTCEVQNYVDRDPGPAVKDWRCGGRTYEAHGGVDFRIPDLAAQRRGVDVLAAAAGKVTRLRDGVADISVRAQATGAVAGQECGNGVVIDHGGGWETQYCHLAKGSVRVKAGDEVQAGQPIARVGLSGNTEYPHLHLTVREAGRTVDPFAPGPTCDAAAAAGGLWSPAAAAQMPYQTGAVLNTGFAPGPVDNTQVEAGGLAPPTADAPALVAYVRAIGLRGGDVLRLTVSGPDGAVLADSKMPPLDRDKAQHLLYAGKKRPPAGWPKGTYKARYEVTRAGKVALTRSFAFTL